MYNEQEFNDANNVILKMICFRDMLIEDFSIRTDLKQVLLREAHIVETSSQLKEHLSMILREDLLACCFALGYPVDYDSSSFEHFDLLNYYLFSDVKEIDYNGYLDYSNKSYVLDYCKSMFEIFEERALKHKGTSTLSTVLFQLSDPYYKVNTDILQILIGQLVQKNNLVTTQGQEWFQKIIENPKALLRIKEDYQIKSDEMRTDSISREQFELIEKVLDELFDFVKTELNNSSSLIKVFKTDSSNVASITNVNGFNGTVKTLVTKDLCECYKKLNHSLDLNSIEGKVLLAFLLKYLDVKLDYSLFNSFCDGNSPDSTIRSIRKSCETIFHVDFEKKIDIDSEFRIPYFLNQIDVELSKKYMVILYRCASVIAKIDGHISESESQWLSNLVSQVGISKEEEKCASFEIAEGKKPIQELESLIGLDSVKNDVVSLTNFIKMRQMREAKGLKAPGISYHCVFTGNPGTGKTTVARILASIFKELGILQSGHLVETDRSGLVAEYVGQTAIKTNKIIDSALDGVLFVDEAYMLLGGQNDYGKEAIATLLKRMEDDRDRLIVILAGYSHEMEDFISSNPGLRSRFNRFIFFPDYSSEELFQIFKLNVEKNEYVMKDDAAQFVKSKLDDVLKTKRNDFGNARYVRNYFESVIEHQANRLASDVDLSVEKLTELTLEDVSMGQINS